MKKVGLVLLPLLTVGLLTGCGNSSEGASSGESSSSTTTETVEASEDNQTSEIDDQFAGQEEKGTGTFDILNVSGSTADGAEIKVVYDPNVFPTAIDVETADIDGSLTSFIYVDGELVAEEQLGTSRTEIHLQDVASAITEGEHTIQLVQFESNDPSAEIVTFKTQKYTVELK